MNRRGFLGSLLGVATAGAAVQASVPVGDPALQSGDVVAMPMHLCTSCGSALYHETCENRPLRIMASCFRCQKSWLLVLPPVAYEPAKFKAKV
jgi:hypothetical protein